MISSIRGTHRRPTLRRRLIFLPQSDRGYHCQHHYLQYDMSPMRRTREGPGTYCVVPPSQLLVKPACTLPRAQKADLLPTAKWRLLSLSSPYVDQGETETKTNIKPGGPREAVPPSQPSSSITVSHHPKFSVSHVRPQRVWGPKGDGPTL